MTRLSNSARKLIISSSLEKESVLLCPDRHIEAYGRRGTSIRRQLGLIGLAPPPVTYGRSHSNTPRCTGLNPGGLGV